MVRFVLAIQFVLLHVAGATAPVQPVGLNKPVVNIDEDHDGLDDRWEQAILEKFRPRLHISKEDCDTLPAEFLTGIPEPKVLSRNGTIYGQVFSRSFRNRSGAFVEVHYYHLWGRDCGKGGHALDAEHVSVLIRAEGADLPASEWKALYWYAAAHEHTPCDISNAARARDLNAEENGAEVWVSHGKHASFLSENQCKRGCGADRCSNEPALVPMKIINIGELGAVRHESHWVASNAWPLANKFQADFSEEMVDGMDRSAHTDVYTLHPQLRAPQAVFLASTATADALGVAGLQTDAALDVSARSTEEALAKSMSSTGNALAKSVAQAGKALRVAIGSVIRPLRSRKQ